MTELTKERIQQIWDYELVSAWDGKGSRKMSSVVFAFLSRVNPSLTGQDVDFNNIEKYLVKLNLKRCLSYHVVKGEKVAGWHQWKTDVIGFIHARCLCMSLDLINGKDKVSILMDIDTYKFKRINQSSGNGFAVKKNYSRKYNHGNRRVKYRELDFRSSWGTTK